MKNNSNTNMVTDKTRALPVDPNLPRWVCQNCRHSLSITGVDSYPDKFFNDSSTYRSGMQGCSMHGAGSVLGSRMDQSFVVLPKQRNQSPSGGGGIPPRPRDSGKGGGAMEESFVVLPPPAASVYKAADGGGSWTNHVPSQEGGAAAAPPAQSNNSGFHSTITVLKRAFEIATTQTQVEQPLCLECMRVLSDKLDKEVEDVNSDIKA